MSGGALLNIKEFNFFFFGSQQRLAVKGWVGADQATVDLLVLFLTPGSGGALGTYTRAFVPGPSRVSGVALGIWLAGSNPPSGPCEAWESFQTLKNFSGRPAGQGSLQGTQGLDSQQTEQRGLGGCEGKPAVL